MTAAEPAGRVVRCLARTAIATALAIAAVVGGPSSASAGPEQATPLPRCSKDFCVEDEQTTPAQPAADPVATPARSEPPECIWREEPPAGFDPTAGPTTFFELEGEQTSDPHVAYEFCDGRFSGRMRWVTPAAPGPLPTPGALAQVVRARLEGNLPTPVVTADPAPGQAAIISVPTFVEVSNWTGVVSDRECDSTGALCVAVTATPAVLFDPGEPGAPVIACDGAGTRFVASGETSEAQAAGPTACAHAYRFRTGVDARPDAWHARVTVTWDLTWTSTSGERGELPGVVKSVGLDRPVNEVQTVVER
jgi:hypothetical protein